MHEYYSPDSHPNLVAGRSVDLTTSAMDSAMVPGHGGRRKIRQKMPMKAKSQSHPGMKYSRSL
jgi:hypothetical protein